MRKHLMLPALLLACLASAAGAGGPWETDFSRATARADKENKLLLIYFTGSDW